MAAPKEGGFKMSLGGLKIKPGLKASLQQKDAKRPRLALGDDEPTESNERQEISGWDAAEGGAVDVAGKKEKEGPRIIPSQPNRDWRAEARRIQLAKAPHQQVQNGDMEDQMEKQKVQYGLTILKKDEPQEITAEESVASEPKVIEKDNLTEEQRLEKKALDALLNGKSSGSDLVIPVQTEEEALQYDLNNAPDAPTLEAYEATPIEGFGAALLRGMGWKDGEAIGKNGITPKPVEIKRRPALLGIGAKADAAVGVELGEWTGKGKGKKMAETYNPVTLRNKKTGEMITEDELKAKLESQDMIQDEKPEKARRTYDDEEEHDQRRREKRKERRDDKDRERYRDSDYDSERRRRDRKDDRHRDRDDYYDSDRRRDKRREKDRYDDYDNERNRDNRRDRDRDAKYDHEGERRKDKRRDRSRSVDGRQEGRRDRYRSRSRDSRRERDRRDRSKDSDDRRKRRREREYEYDDDRDDRKRRHKDEKYHKK